MQQDGIYPLVLSGGHVVTWDAGRNVLMETDPRFPYELECDTLRAGLSHIDNGILGVVDIVYRVNLCLKKKREIILIE